MPQHQTAMSAMIEDLQESIQDIDELIAEITDETKLRRLNALKELIKEHIAYANELLEAEKHQITEAYRKGVEDERYDKLDFKRKPYYETTYQ